jgi:hypothetical protein
LFDDDSDRTWALILQRRVYTVRRMTACQVTAPCFAFRFLSEAILFTPNRG